MYKKIIQRYLFDFFMLMVLVVLMSYNSTNSLVYELLEGIFFALVIIHNVKNLRKCKSIFKSENIKLNYKVYLRRIVDALLIIVTCLLFVSSILICEKLISFLNISVSSIWSNLHRVCMCLELILVSIHLGFHFDEIMKCTKKIFNISGENIVRKTILRVLVIVIVVLGVKASCDRNIGSKLLINSEVSNYSQEGNQMERPDMPNSNGNSEMTPPDGNNNSDDNADSNNSEDESDSSVENLSVNLGSDTKVSLLGTSINNSNQNGNYNESQNSNYNNRNNSGIEDGAGPSGGGFNSGDNSNRPPTDGQMMPNGQPGGEMQERADGQDSIFKIIFDYICIIGLYVSGTYYLLKVIDKIKNRNRE